MQSYAPQAYGSQAPEPTPLERPRRANQFKVYHDFPIQPFTRWDVPSAIDAIDQHSYGMFQQSGQLADSVTSDDSLDAVLNTRELGLLSHATVLKLPKNSRNERRARIARDALKERLPSIVPDEVVAAMIRGSILMGFFIAQVVWRKDDGLITPELVPWHPSLIQYRWDTRTYQANTMEGPVHVLPGTGQWLLFAPYGAFRGWLRGAVRSVAMPYLSRQYALRDWNRYNEVHGLPIKKAKAPAGASAFEKQQFARTIGNRGNESAILLPQGVGGDDAQSFDLDLLEATADTWEAFQGLIDKCEKRMAIRVLGQNLTTDVDAGSLAAANVHEHVRLDYVRADARALSKCIREQLFKSFCFFNYGDEDCAPIHEWDCKDPEDRATKATAMASIGTALTAFIQAGAPVDTRKLLEESGVPTLPRGVKSPVAPAAPGEPPPPAPAPTPPAEPAEPPDPTETTKLAAGAHTALLAAQKRNLTGQLFVDATADAGAAEASEVLAAHVKAVQAALTGATSYDDARKRLKKVLGAANPAALAKVLEQSMIASDLAGRHATARTR